MVACCSLHNDQCTFNPVEIPQDFWFFGFEAESFEKQLSSEYNVELSGADSALCPLFIFD
jgi:hypothetical protein